MYNVMKPSWQFTFCKTKQILYREDFIFGDNLDIYIQIPLRYKDIKMVQELTIISDILIMLFQKYSLAYIPSFFLREHVNRRICFQGYLFIYKILRLYFIDQNMPGIFTFFYIFGVGFCILMLLGKLIFFEFKHLFIHSLI